MTRASTTETGGLILFLVVVFVVFSRTRNHQTVPVASAPRFVHLLQFTELVRLL